MAACLLPPLFWGLVILTLQAQMPSLKPPICVSANRNTPCQEVDGGKAVLFFAGLYLVALGVGGIKGSLAPHGAEQFDENNPKERKLRSTFFNYYVFSLSCGALIAVTFVVWIEDNKGWQWGFGISTATILISIPIFLLGSATYRTKIPTGSPITTIFKVLAAAIYNTGVSRNPSNSVVSMNISPSYTTDTSEEEGHAKERAQVHTTTEDLKFLNRAVINKPVHPALECTITQVEDVKIVLKTLPIFMSTIMLNCCLAQLSTFSVQQAATMNTKIGSLRVPPASLPVFPVLFIMILAPVYNHIIIPFARKVTKTEMALVEMKRKRVAAQAGLLNSTEPLPITFLWVALQYLFLGSADLFSLAGMMEFFFTEAPISMRSLATALSWASLAVGPLSISFILGGSNFARKIYTKKQKSGRLLLFFSESMGNLLCCTQVDQSTVAIKERFGKFEEVLEPGCHCLPWILGCQLAGHLSLRLQQLDVRCETKTKDNVFVNVVASVQYRALADKASDAFYKLSNTRSQIQAYVFDVIRASVPKLNLDDAFEQKNEIAEAVEEELEKAMSAYGYEIVQTLIVDIEPDEHVKRAMNEINAAARLRVAANEKAEAEKILQIKRAEGEAESKYLSGLGIARQRQAIVDGLRDSVLGFSVNVPGTTAKDVMDMVLVTQYFDTMKEIGAASKSSAVFIPHGPGAVRDVATQIRDGLLQASADN
ncbi:hypothetical protein F0562_024935 [Nyssa sinensis]|uniref:Band 7 domain-containing protein n=2 Tax=Pentapetalae TaxID=1437201 RepID=A0A5J5BGQ4_9ASTE|nr:hypothetical protein F0562_024935 [Nyssa sinensis]